jgi:hypothetical protein
MRFFLKRLWLKVFGIHLTKEQKAKVKEIKRNAFFEESKKLAELKGKKQAEYRFRV